MNKLEPTYLRYIYDELGRGSLSSDNASSLPHGFIGLFEKEFSSDIPISQRSSTLRRLCLWALLKKAVSSEFVSEVLKENTDSTKALIDTYSKWFNSPEPGKYVLFHDRLRSYLIQKLSDHEVQEINEQLIAYLEQSLESSVGEESELYALEHLSTHMAVESQLENNYKRLHAFVNREDLWPRQVRASKEYKWSQKGVQYGIMEGARRHDEMNTLTSTVNSVKLHQEEQSNFKQILELLNEGEVDLVFSRLLSFKDDILKVCILILHECLIEKSVNQDVIIKVCNEILNKIEESSLDFPKYNSLLLYKYFLKLREYNIDYLGLVRKSGFGFQDILFLLDFENVDIDSLVTISNETIHDSYLAEIYLKIAYRFKKFSNSKKAFEYLDKSFEKLKSYPVSFGKYYEFTGFDSKDVAFYENSLKTSLIISKLNFDFGRKKISLQSLEKTINFNNKLSITSKESKNSTFTTNSLPESGGNYGYEASYCDKIFLMLVVLMEYDKAMSFYKTCYIDYELNSIYDDNWSESLHGVKKNIFNISSKIILKENSKDTYTKFLIFLIILVDQLKTLEFHTIK